MRSENLSLELTPRECAALAFIVQTVSDPIMRVISRVDTYDELSPRDGAIFCAMKDAQKAFAKIAEVGIAHAEKNASPKP